MANEKELRMMAQKRIAFKTHLLTYTIINTVLFFINNVLTPGTLWFYWVPIFWGIGLVFHYVHTYHFNGLLSEEKEYQKLKAKKKRKK